MKYYWCVLACASIPLIWGADAVRVSYHVETVAGSSRIGDGGPPLGAQFSSIQGIAIDRLGNKALVVVRGDDDGDLGRCRAIVIGSRSTPEEAVLGG